MSILDWLAAVAVITGILLIAASALTDDGNDGK